MSTVKEIEQAIRGLTVEDVQRLDEWLRLYSAAQQGRAAVEAGAVRDWSPQVTDEIRQQARLRAAELGDSRGES